MKKKTTYRRKQSRRRRTFRSRRGGSKEIDDIIASVKMKPNFPNPSSKFVVVTYWWGRKNPNRNTQRPCPEDITEAIKEIMEEELMEEDDEENMSKHQRETYKAYRLVQSEFLPIRDAIRKAKKDATKEQLELFKAKKDARNKLVTEYFAREDVLLDIKARTPKYEASLRKQGKFKEPLLFEVMIANWEAKCKAANCNYMAVEYPQFAQPGGYQLAINAKPAFIRKALTVLGGRAAMYIDGDMIINKYPAIFDMPNVDFMARGWNVDPRGSPSVYKRAVCFDPYIFETSGGTMYFANTPSANALLLDWQKESDKPSSKGKADDRILSLLFTSKRYIPHTNTIQLPVEYLWLGELYNGVIDKADVSVPDIYIEHPECLTGEERASELSLEKATSSREPKFYGRLIESRIECARRGGVFYERIFFPTKDMVSAFAPYLKYMKNAVHHETKKPMFEVVDYEDGYGRYNTIAFKNREAAKLVKIGDGALPLTATIPTILAHLNGGIDVKLGAVGQVPPLTEAMATNLRGDEGIYPMNIKVDITKPVFLSAKNPILVQLIAMCATLADINKHLEESYVFMSRIRWAFDE